MLPKAIQILIDQFAKLPSVGPRQAARFVFYLTKQPKAEIERFAKDILSLTKNLKKCHACRRISESQMCDICTNKKRDKSVVCIIEKDTDIEVIEKTGRYNGLYHVLGDRNEAEFKELIKN